MLRKIVNAVLCVVLFINSALIVEAKTTYTVPSDNSFKAYMDYRTISNKKSKQYKLQQLCTTAENGVRIYDDRYCIALGNGFDVKIGSCVDVHLDSGEIIPCVVGDLKQNQHTGVDNMQVTSNGNIVEFIVDKEELDSKVASSGNLNNYDDFAGEITSIDVMGVADVPEYTIISKYEISTYNNTLYVITYRLGEHTNAIEVSKEEYEQYQIFCSMYSADEY